MKTIGLLGGMSWESTIPYYRLINEGVKENWVACTPPACCCTA
jgi:aspartate/glutamate racemase